MTRPVAPESLLSSAKEMQINWTRSSGEKGDLQDIAVTRIPYLLCSHIAHTPGWQATHDGNQSNA